MARRGRTILLISAVLLSAYFAAEALVGLFGIGLHFAGVSPGETNAAQALLGSIVLAALLVWALVQPRLIRVACGLALFSVIGLTTIYLSPIAV
ncbi:hypothetical protein [Leptolyngbya sp. 7M]|uniref:hypothetical protein n=1 Tax=Leptolyngbya sp. 7M TaxID=2812896 RepID=UPI001B8C217F|nr:hypothetical protein [Leptolyngbya sp. 7M]QYO63838.1 hypothetical protein JVX88_29110 [Leptolyngbya sp. 7M]QYU69089.1 hypothetical protein J4558_02790 [Leptolyngbya sp. 15MV]